MSDISSADNLFETLLETAYFRLGIENWTPCYIASDDHRPRAAEIKRLVTSAKLPWVVFLNARETPGANTAKVGVPRRLHGWLDNPRRANPSGNGSDESDNAESFRELIDELTQRDKEKAENEAAGISVVLLCRELKSDSALGKVIDETPELDLRAELPESTGLRFDEEDIVRTAIRWAAQVPERGRFLHALILMQRPRALAAVWSRALCMRRSDGEVPDDTLLLGWLKKLEETGLLRRKLGGFIWIHVRCRERLREVLRSPEAIAPVISDLGSSWVPVREEADIHAELAEWYTHLLDSSGRPTAVFEIVYHLCSAAESRLLEAISVPALRWAADKVAAATAVLRTHGQLIQTRGYSRESCKRLAFTRTSLCSAIFAPASRISDVALTELTEPTQQLDTAITQLRIVCTEIMRAVAREVGEDSKTYQRHLELADLHIRNSRREARWGELVHQSATPSRPKEGWSAALNRVLTSGHQESFDRLQWLRWWRWSGMLGIASRSYEMAESALRKALHYATDADPTYPPGQLPAWDAASTPPLSLQHRESQELRIELLRIAEQYIALQLLKYSLEHRLQGLPAPGERNFAAMTLSDAERQQLLSSLDNIEAQIEAARALACVVRGSDTLPGSYHTVTAVWCHSRLLIHMSSCKAHRRQLDPQRKHLIPQTAMGLLGQAESCLRVADPLRYRSELALIDLYRGEARLRRAEAVELGWGGRHQPVSLALICRHLEQWTPPRTGLASQNKRALLEEFSWLKDPPSNLREARSLVEDALRFLTRAEPVLRERRRNVWWTTWYFERKLRAISLSVWLSIFDTDIPIPHLGYEAAAASADTSAAILLDFSIRMIRVDAYRLATIIDAYTSCIKALQVRLWIGKKHDFEGYKSRLADMCERLVAALESLQTVCRAREDVRRGLDDKERIRDDAQPSPEILAYVAAVQKRSAWILKDHFYKLIRKR